MIRLIRCARIVFLVLAILCIAVPAFSFHATKQLAPGIVLNQDINTAHGSELITNAVTIDLSDPTVSLKAALCKDVVYLKDPTKGREAISSLTARKSAVVGINADFFPFTGDPLGICVTDGEIVSEPGADRVALAMLKDRKIVFDNPILDAKLTLSSGISRQIDGINRPRESNQVILFTNACGAVTVGTAGTELVLKSDGLPLRIGKKTSFTVTAINPESTGTPIPKGGAVLSAGGPAAYFIKENLRVGDTFNIEFNIKSTNNVDWTQVEQAAGGGPWLVKDGSQYVDSDAEHFNNSFSTTHHPRSAVGVTADNKLILVTVDGRQSISHGISLTDLSALMRRLGAVNAINIDGGGSTTLSYRGILLNSPSGGTERPVADALLVFSSQADNIELPELTVSGVEDVVPSGHGSQLFVTWDDDAQVLTADQLDKVVWGTNGGVGFVNQLGYFTPIKAQKGAVRAFYGLQSTAKNVKVISGSAAGMNVKLTQDKNNPFRSEVTVTVTDEDSNGSAGNQVILSVTGGKADINSGNTDKNGEFLTSIIWDKDAKDHSVAASSGALTDKADFELKEEADK